MKIKPTCKLCKKPFKRRASGQKYCCDNCSISAEKIRLKRYNCVYQKVHKEEIAKNKKLYHKNNFEFLCVINHYHYIFNKKHLNYKYYKEMPFYDKWNPDKGGSYREGAKWIIDNIGKRPCKKWSLDIVNHYIGFMPGNLRWAKKGLQRMNQRHRILGQISEDEFGIEARKRGYIKI